jgi:hypothetical protein
MRYLFYDYANTAFEDLLCKTAPEDQLAADPLVEIEYILAQVAGKRIVGVVCSDDYPGSALAAAIAKRLGLPGPEPEIVLICQHNICHAWHKRHSCRTLFRTSR